MGTTTPLFSSTEANLWPIETRIASNCYFSEGPFISKKEEGSTREQSGVQFGPPFAEIFRRDIRGALYWAIISPVFLVNDHEKRVKYPEPAQQILRGGTTPSHGKWAPGTFQSARTREISSNPISGNAAQVVCATLGVSCDFSVSALEPPPIQTDISPLQLLLHHY